MRENNEPAVHRQVRSHGGVGLNVFVFVAKSNSNKRMGSVEAAVTTPDIGTRSISVNVLPVGSDAERLKDLVRALKETREQSNAVLTELMTTTPTTLSTAVDKTTAVDNDEEDSDAECSFSALRWRLTTKQIRISLHSWLFVCLFVFCVLCFVFLPFSRNAGTSPQYWAPKEVEKHVK